MQLIFEEFTRWMKIHWQYIIDVTNLLISVLTLLIAFKIFNRFSFKNRVLEKQFESVSNLIHILQDWTISIHAKGIGREEDYFNLGWRVKFFDFKNLKKGENYKELFFDENILFTQEWYDQNPLIGLDNDPFLPKSISKKIEAFKIWLPTRANHHFYKKVIYINLDEFDTSIRRYSDLALICNPKEKCFKNFETFNDLCNDLIEEIETWLKKYDAGDVHLK